YLCMALVELRAGTNTLELRLVSETSTDLRAHYAFVQDPARYLRPELMTPADEPRKDSVIAFERAMSLEFEPQRAVVQVGANAPCRVYVNGQEVGRQGGFDPYFEAHGAARVQPYDVTSYLQAGENRFRFDLSDLGRSGVLLVDALFESGERRETLLSDATWSVTRDGAPRELRLHREQVNDPAWSHLWRRPHPLPGATWLEDDPVPDGTVLPLVPNAHAGRTRVEWFRFPIAPGATSMTLSLHGAATVYVDGEEASAAPLNTGGTASTLEVQLPPSDEPLRVCALRVQTRPGYSEGAVFEGPVRFRTTAGRMRLGDWAQQGLAGFSGAVHYSRTVQWPGTHSGERVLLDLGRVRGTAEVTVNGEPAGVRVLSPYVFDVTERVRSGENELRVSVYNTAGPYLDSVSPTRFVFPGQTLSGILGPVTLRVVRAGVEAAAPAG
ncbi:MAG: hypothetical protein M3281_02430, partial [Chloroflexota bacterium]|nr:hypothetical protein [Chloroflexota bacterium]